MSDTRPLVRPSGVVRDIQESTDILIARHLEPTISTDLTHYDMEIGTAHTDGKKITLGGINTNVEIPGILTVYDIEVGGIPGSLTLGDGDGDVITLGGAYVTAPDVVNLGSVGTVNTILNLRVNMLGDTDARIYLNRDTNTNAALILPSTADNPAGTPQLGMIRVTPSGDLQWYNGIFWDDTKDTDRRPAVEDYVDNTAVPPTEVTGDRYILDFTLGGVAPEWDGAVAGDIVEFNGTTWDAYTPLEGWITYVIAESQDRIYIDGPPPVWEARPPELAVMVPGLGDVSTFRLNSGCTADADYSFSVGQNNLISSTGTHSSVFGRDNSVDGYDCVVGGNQNSVDVGSHSNAVFGYAHTVEDGSTHNLVAGYANIIDTTGFQNAAVGFNNTLSAVLLIFVSGGSNALDLLANCAIFGNSNTISGENSSLISGYSHDIGQVTANGYIGLFGTSHTLDSSSAIVVGGDSHVVDNVPYGAVFGQTITIMNSAYSLAVGSNHTIDDSAYSVVAGSNHVIGTVSGTDYSAIFGNGHTVDSSDMVFISGLTNVASTSAHMSGMIGSSLETDSTFSYLLGSTIELTASAFTFAVGSLHTSSTSQFSVMGGTSNSLIDANNAAMFGSYNQATKGSGLTTGWYARNYYYATQAHSGGKPAASIGDGHGQNLDMIPHTGRTTTTALTEIFMNGYGGSQRFVTQSDATYWLTMRVLAKCIFGSQTDKGVKCWEYSILVDNASGAASIVSSHKRVIHQTKVGNEKEWDVVLSTDVDELVVEVQGSTSVAEQVQWQVFSQGPQTKFALS